MPESSLWALIVSLVLLALGLTYKNADLRHTLKRIRDELSAARSEISSLNEKQQKQIQDIEMNHQARIKELSDVISNLKDQSKQHDNSQPPPKLDGPKIDILTMLYSRKKLTSEEIARSLGLQLQTAAYHLIELAKFGMVNEQRFSEQIQATPFDLPGLRRYYAWSIMQPGRKYLLDNRIVS